MRQILRKKISVYIKGLRIAARIQAKVAD